MLYREIIAVCSEIHTKHINTLCGQNVVELLNVKLVVHIVTTGPYPRSTEYKITNKYGPVLSTCTCSKWEMPRPVRSQFKAAHVTLVQLKLFVLASCGDQLGRSRYFLLPLRRKGIKQRSCQHGVCGCGGVVGGLEVWCVQCGWIAVVSGGRLSSV